jgi:hypothetical protein
MKHILLSMTIVLGVMANGIVFAQEALPNIPAEGKTEQAFMPRGWKAAFNTIADFNKDNQTDKAMLIRSEQQNMLLILLAKADKTYTCSFAGSFSSIEYISKLSKRNNTLQMTFDLPSYPNGHFINVYSRYQNNDWYIIGYSEESYEGLDEASGNSKNAKGLVKDVNLVTGDVAEYTLKGKNKTPKKNYKQQKAPLLLLKDLDSLSVMNW